MVCPGRSSLLSSEQKRWHEETKWSLFLETMLIPGWTRKWFIDMARGRKEMCARGSRLIKLIVFAASLRAFWSELVRSLSRVRLLMTSWTAARQTLPSFTVSQSLLTFMSNESVTLSNYLFLCHPLLFCPSSFPTSFPGGQLFAWGGQSTGASVSPF